MHRRIVQLLLAPTLAVAGVGAVAWTTWIWLDIKDLVPDWILKILLSTTYWLGLYGFLYILFSMVHILCTGKCDLSEVGDTLSADSLEKPNSMFWRSMKWYVIFVGGMVPLFFALQAFGVLSDPWVPRTRSDFGMMLIYTASQVPLLVLALISRQIRWIYNVQFDEGGLCCNLLWFHQRLNVEESFCVGKLDLLVFILPKRLKVPIVIIVPRTVGTE